MAKAINRKNKRAVRKFEKRYQAIIDSTVKRMGNNTMAELNIELDKIRNDMAQEIECRGLRF